MSIAISRTLPLLLGGAFLLTAGVCAGEPNHHLEKMRWEDRVFLVVADGGPVRMSFKDLMEDPTGFFWRRRVGCAVYVGERRLLLTTTSVVGDNPLVEVFTEDGSHVLARIVGLDEHLDLALLEAVEDLPRTEDLEPLQPAAEPARGASCMVLGRAYGSSLSACRGTMGEHVVLMATGVPVQVRRVNVPIYPGDAGGPVLDPDGRFLGLVTAASGAGWDEEGAVREEAGQFEIGDRRARPSARSGFAVSAAACDRAWRDLRAHGRVRRGFLGVQMPLDYTFEVGARVLQVLPGSPAELFGIRPGDRIVSLGRRAVTDPRQFCALVAATAPNVQLDLRFIRDEQEYAVTVRLGEAVRLPGILQRPVPREEETPVLSETTADRPSN